MLTEGTSAPAWKGLDHDGHSVGPEQYAGRWLLLYFYPQDDTPGCTKEACGFRDHSAALQDRLAIVGISSDSVESHAAFRTKYRLPFTLVSDPLRQILSSYGIGSALPKRTTFLIDDQGVIRKIYHGFDCTTHAREIEKDLGQFGIEGPAACRANIVV